jgi:E1 N-terminal domain/ThiF family
MITARQENARTLAAALGSTEDEAAVLLDAVVLLTVASGKDRLGAWLRLLLERTLANIITEPNPSVTPSLEVVIGETAARSRAAVVSVSTAGSKFGIRDGVALQCGNLDNSPAMVDLLAACYAAATAVQRATDGELPMALRLPIEVDLTDLLGVDAASLEGPIELGTIFMAGAGAIGNGLLLGVSALDVGGELHVCDPDTVSAGNLNRCIWFATEDVGKHKAHQLVRRVQGYVPRLRLVPHACALKDLPAARAGGAWLDRLIVAVDSRRARRSLQNEMPRCVFDAPSLPMWVRQLGSNSLL